MKPTYEELELQNQELRRIIREQQEQIARLQAEIDALKSQLGRNSKNSSKSPSSDQKANLPVREKSEHRPYHPGTARQLLPEDMVTSRETRTIETCPRCRYKMDPTGQCEKWQQVEILEIKPLVHEIVLQTCRCPKCHLKVRPRLAESETFLLGPRLEGFVNLLLAQFRQGHRGVRSLLKVLIPGLELSQGLISKIKKRTAQVFDHATEELTQALLQSEEPKYIDPTGWRHCGVNEHLFIIRTQKCVRYAIKRFQNRKTVDALLDGGIESGVTDRGLPISASTIRRHQFCLAHLLRNIQGAAEHDATSLEDTQTLGEIHETLQSLFHERHLHDKGKLAQSTYRSYSYRKWAWMREEFSRLAESGSHAVLRRFCKRVLRQWKKFITYLATDGPMTNNLAEEGLRNLVIARKLCFGSRSSYGKAWRENLHSCIETLRKHKGGAIEFIADTIRAFRTGLPYPSILEAASRSP